MLRAGLWHRGKTFAVNADDPPVGANFMYQLPQQPEGVWWKVKAISFRILASAAAGNRSPRVWFGPSVPDLRFNGAPPDGAYVTCNSTQVAAAAATAFFHFWEGAAIATASSPLPADFRVPAGHYIGSFAGNLDVGDQYSNIRIVLEEWIYEPPGERYPNIGDGSGRVDAIDVGKLNGTLERLAQLLEAQQATP